LKELRNRKGYSLRSLAQLSGLNINTLSLIENGKTSPSVSTIQQLAVALNIPITAFFESKPDNRRVVFTNGQDAPFSAYGNARLQYLGKDLAGNKVQPFIVSLEPGQISPEHPAVHAGHEFAYCLAGNIRYQIDNVEYTLHPGDSLVFESHLPHCWTIVSPDEAKMVLVFFPSNVDMNPGNQHFSTQMHEE
jgi:transcriptional regulator with XRE-family HTH domain